MVKSTSDVGVLSKAQVKAILGWIEGADRTDHDDTGPSIHVTLPEELAVALTQHLMLMTGGGQSASVTRMPLSPNVVPAQSAPPPEKQWQPREFDPDVKLRLITYCEDCGGPCRCRG